MNLNYVEKADQIMIYKSLFIIACVVLYFCYMLRPRSNQQLRISEPFRRVGSESYFPPITVNIDDITHSVSGVYRYYYSDGTFEQVSERRPVR